MLLSSPAHHSYQHRANMQNMPPHVASHVPSEGPSRAVRHSSAISKLSRLSSPSSRLPAHLFICPSRCCSQEPSNTSKQHSSPSPPSCLSVPHVISLSACIYIRNQPKRKYKKKPPNKPNLTMHGCCASPPPKPPPRRPSRKSPDPETLPINPIVAQRMAIVRCLARDLPYNLAALPADRQRQPMPTNRADHAECAPADGCRWSGG
ncbi:hypothetical protein IWX49DRAFT_213629 [Phyllosticta citricarpa]|uniref:Uncharacterized protein n=2 Tax=Phyllosticta TaxID=121621 RepID=A0ABR1MM27_9PEZI